MSKTFHYFLFLTIYIIFNNRPCYAKFSVFIGLQRYNNYWTFTKLLNSFSNKKSCVAHSLRYLMFLVIPDHNQELQMYHSHRSQKCI